QLKQIWVLKICCPCATISCVTPSGSSTFAPTVDCAGCCVVAGASASVSTAGCSPASPPHADRISAAATANSPFRPVCPLTFHSPCLEYAAAPPLGRPTATRIIPRARDHVKETQAASLRRPTAPASARAPPPAPGPAI